MKEPEMIFGYAEYDSGKYTFVYEKGMLNLLPDTKMEWQTRKTNLLNFFSEPSSFKIKNEWIPNAHIKGITKEGKDILFISKGNSINNNGFIQYEIIVIYEYQSNYPNGELISGLVLTADEIDYFFKPSRVFSSEMFFNKEDNTINRITVKSERDSNHTIQCGSYNSGDITVNVEISAYFIYSNRSENPLSAQSQICIQFNKAIVLDKALDIINQLKSFLKYICYRKNINIRNINVFGQNDKGLRINEGKKTTFPLLQLV